MCCDISILYVDISWKSPLKLIFFFKETSRNTKRCGSGIQQKAQKKKQNRIMSFLSFALAKQIQVTKTKLLLIWKNPSCSIGNTSSFMVDVQSLVLTGV